MIIQEYQIKLIIFDIAFDCDRVRVAGPWAYRYLLMIVGWEGVRRIHGCIIHVEMLEGKIWIHRDGTEDSITGELLQAGIPKERIVLGFKSPQVRKHTGFAVA